MAVLSNAFTGTGAGPVISVAKGDAVSYAVTGTFDGTWVLQKSYTGGQTWEQVATGTSTASATTVRNLGQQGGAMLLRFICSAYVSGTISTAITESAVQVGAITNPVTGADVISILEDGISVVGNATFSGVVTATSAALTTPVVTTPAISGGTADGVTITAGIYGHTKRCTTATVADQTTTLANITGLTGFALVASGVYDFDVDLQVTCSTNGGIGVAFKYTTATLTSIQSKVTAMSASALVNAAQFTTATDAALQFNSKAAAFLNIRLKGTLVVNEAGTLAVQVAQETSHTDVTTVLVGSTARFTRIS